MRRGILLDTGPLVALVNRRDQYHDWALAQWNQIAPPMFTCEAVLSEVCFVLRGAGAGSESVLQMVQRGVITLPFRLEGQAQAVSRLLRKYAQVPMSLADACLVRMSEVHPDGAVLTLDGDFRLYRRANRQAIPVLMPDQAAS